ncbi:dTDP-4-dehydrorhamnose reductase [Alistipes sp. An116]|uniref:dTDP-4-dehydrorhamnose reductase n=1 Tax=Alistipes sp. An116 TaxID=1965546 RepID=UPI000B383084|nr:dTDP-4-dehydrorhamnose reductase [Alistipes sp. An116]OUQ54521.1 dTDP-4-dehydrorhamnose reductase [Alistipes sp. An116]
MNILVTGANGQLGREMQRLGAVSPNNYLFTDVAELDITDPEAVRRCVTGNRIEAIVNCAAYTNVERAEEDEATADRLNRAAVGNLARAAAEADALLVHVSTDYVFDGCASLPYTEEDPTAPRSAYGRTKLAGEEAVRASGCRHLILRTAWLYSEYGNNFLKTMLRLTAERETLNVVFDQVGTPTYAGDLALAIFSILEGGLDRGHEGTYHFSDEGVCSWYDFAVEIARAAGHDRCRISPCRTADYPTKAVRPAFSVLDKGKLKRTFGIEIPHWRESMFYCLKRLQAMQNQPSEQS